MNRSSNCDDYIYEVLNHADIEDIEANDLDDITASRIKAKINKKIKRKKLMSTKVKVAVGAMFIATNIMLCVTNGSSVYANMGKSIVKTFKELVGDYAEYEKYSKNVNLSSYDKGIKIILNEVVTDGNEINLSYSLVSDGNLRNVVEYPSMLMVDFKVNDKSVKGYSGVGSIVSDNRYDGVLEIHNTSDIISNDIFYLDMKVSSIDKLKGNWSFKIRIDTTDVKNKIKKYEVNKIIDLGNGDKMKIGRINITPLSIAIEALGDFYKYKYFLIDDKGNQIPQKDGGATVAKRIDANDREGTINFRKLINDNTKSLTLIPYELNLDEKSEWVIYDINSLPMELSQGNLGKLIVNKLEWLKDDTLKVCYKVEGLVPVTQFQRLELFNENNEPIIFCEKYDSKINSSDQRHFEMTVKGVDRNKKYKIGIRDMDKFFKIREELKFTIELK